MVRRSIASLMTIFNLIVDGQNLFVRLVDIPPCVLVNMGRRATTHPFVYSYNASNVHPYISHRFHLDPIVLHVQVIIVVVDSRPSLHVSSVSNHDPGTRAKRGIKCKRTSQTNHHARVQVFVLNRWTTGTELGGKLPYSVMTMLINSAGVTS